MYVCVYVCNSSAEAGELSLSDPRYRSLLYVDFLRESFGELLPVLHHRKSVSSGPEDGVLFAGRGELRRRQTAPRRQPSFRRRRRGGRGRTIKPHRGPR